jgi:hypothetical protein
MSATLGTCTLQPPSYSSRRRKIKCDMVQPVCGPCRTHARQCGGVGYSKRLIVKDETEKFINLNTFSSRKSKSHSSATAIMKSPSQARSPPGPPTIIPVGENHINDLDPRTLSSSSVGSIHPPLFHVHSNGRLSESYEQLQLAIFCCRQTLTLRTFTWVMSEIKWTSMIHDTMSKSRALTSAVRANAANHLAKCAGALDTPIQALTEYAAALKYLQRDLYDPVKQRSNETLFTVLLLGIFDVLLPGEEIANSRYIMGMRTILWRGMHIFGERARLSNVMVRNITPQIYQRRS